MIKAVWAFAGNRIAIRFVYEFHDGTGAWFRAHGNEQWEFDEHGLMKRREATINDVSIRDSERLLPLEPGAAPRAPSGPFGHRTCRCVLAVPGLGAHLMDETREAA